MFAPPVPPMFLSRFEGPVDETFAPHHRLAVLVCFPGEENRYVIGDPSTIFVRAHPSAQAAGGLGLAALQDDVVAVPSIVTRTNCHGLSIR